MAEIYCSEIIVNKVRSLKEIRIPISNEHRQHLILTGPNGSGKTSLLLEIKRYLQSVQTGHFGQLKEWHKQLDLGFSDDEENLLRIEKKFSEDNKTSRRLTNLKNQINGFEEGVSLQFKNDENLDSEFKSGKFLIAMFAAHRNVSMVVPDSIRRVNLKNNYNSDERENTNFIQYMVSLKADRAFANDDNDLNAVIKIDSWFNNFQTKLSEIMENDSLKLIFDRHKYNFNIKSSNESVFDFNTLSDGFAAILNIVTELILRMEKNKEKAYDIQGIVLIDEIENHLHIQLQKKILPFLTAFFPRIQFIISTHSPFVISSLENCVVFDLKKKEGVENLSAFSYDALVEGFFGVDKYSSQIKTIIEKFESLASKSEMNEQDKLEFTKMRNYLVHSQSPLSPELAIKINQILMRLQKYG